MTLEWKDPPPLGGTVQRSREIDAIVEELQARPGEWAIVVPDGTAASVKTYQRRGCEARAARTTTDERGRWRHTIYARWPAQ